MLALNRRSPGFTLKLRILKMRISDPVRPSSERLLKQVQAEENKRRGARLKIFLGYAPGVGKSYRMLDEARRRHERGEDVVVGAVQGEQSEDVKALLQQLESIPSATALTRPGAIDYSAIPSFGSFGPATVSMCAQSADKSGQETYVYGQKRVPGIRLTVLQIW
jgi:hypothetical protein